MNKTFKYDFFSLRNTHIQKWHNEFFWPIPWETTTDITTQLEKEQLRIINDLGDSFEGDCLLIGRHICLTYARVLNHYLSVLRLQKKGFLIEYSNYLDIVPSLLNENLNIQLDFRNIENFNQKKKYACSIKNFLKSLAYNCNLGKYNPFSHFIHDRCVYAHSFNWTIDRPYTKNLNNWLRIISSEELVDKTSGSIISKFTKNIFKEVSNSLVSFTKNFFINRFGERLKDFIETAMFECAYNYLVQIAKVYSSLKRKINKIHPEILITPSPLNAFHRAVCLAVKDNGGRVIGFAMGYDICTYSYPRRAWGYLAIADDFVVYSPGSIPLFKRSIMTNPPPRRHNINIINENSELFIDKWKYWQTKGIPEVITTVMILELSLIPEWTGYYRTDSMVNYHFYYSICKVLSDNGYQVIFKRRPKNLNWNGINIFNGIPNVIIEYEPFEKPGIMEKTDAIICQFSLSSTLNWSIISNKTVIYVDAGLEPWYPDVYELLTRRCRILRCWYDERNRQCFDEDELLELLKIPPDVPNTEYLEKYLFPICSR